jgi:hypothetical protein
MNSSTFPAKILGMSIRKSHHIVFANSKFDKINVSFDETQP